MMSDSKEERQSSYYELTRSNQFIGETVSICMMLSLITLKMTSVFKLTMKILKLIEITLQLSFLRKFSLT